MSDVMLTLHQELRLSPQLIQSAAILRMDAQELLEYLGRVREENPVVEQEEPLRRDYEALRRRASWVDAGLMPQDAGSIPEVGRRERELESLQAFLLDQLHRLRLEKKLQRSCAYIICHLDGDGYLDSEDLEGVEEGEAALKIVQSLEPPGVGARSLSECLLLQLGRGETVDPLGSAIVSEYLPQLGRRSYAAIAKALGVKTEAVKAAAERIAALEPYPGRNYQEEEETLYVRPDLFVLEEAGQWQVVLNEYYLPRVSVSPYYETLMKEVEDPQTREYLRQKLRHAHWVIEGLERRGTTLRRCGEEVLELQRPFFAGETDELVPMTLARLAERLELHPSTVTRALRGKYLQCRRGMYPLKYFFSGGVGEEYSRQAVKHRILTCIREEDPRHPLSDRAICEELSRQGIQIARRTVAKYRESAGIPVAAARRKESL